MNIISNYYLETAWGKNSKTLLARLLLSQLDSSSKNAVLPFNIRDLLCEFSRGWLLT
jgi:hypothetical protein